MDLIFFFNQKHTHLFFSCIFSILQKPAQKSASSQAFNLLKNYLVGSEGFEDYFNIVKKWCKEQDKIIEGMRNVKNILHAQKCCSIFHWVKSVVFVFFIEKKRKKIRVFLNSVILVLSQRQSIKRPNFSTKILLPLQLLSISPLMQSQLYTALNAMEKISSPCDRS